MNDRVTLSNSATDDQYAQYAREYRTQKRRCDEENGVLRSILKRADADGIPTKALVSAVKKTKLEPEVVVGDLRDEIRFLRILRIEVPQDEIYGDWSVNMTSKSRQQDDVWLAEDAGYRAARHGVPLDDCPHLPGTELHVAWCKHWKGGEASLKREMGGDQKIASTSRKRPGAPAHEDESLSVPETRKTPRKPSGSGASTFGA